MLQAARRSADAPDAARCAPARLAAVARSGLLDSEREPAFDALTRMAATLLRAPMSFVAVVTDERDFYKSEFGFAPAVAAARELSGRTLCHHLLGLTDPLVIGDTDADPVWRAVPMVQSLGVRAYAGVPLEVDGQTVGSFCVVDVQPRVWNDEDLRILKQLALSAGREISVRVARASARDATARALALARANEEIVAVMAHDLRTPLQVMALSVAVLRRADPDMPPLVARMDNAISSMKRMVDDLLRTHAGEQAPTPELRTSIAPAQLLADAADTMGMIAARAGIDLTVAQPDPGDGGAAPHLSVDYAQMLRVLCNLICNAIKFSPRDSSVVLSAAHDARSVHLSVADEGHGIDAQELPHAFERGWQGPEGRERGDGAGLGLAIVKDLVERHGGQVHLASPVGRGTTAQVSLPIQR
jgi:signal transduction histidine kinase